MRNKRVREELKDKALRCNQRGKCRGKSKKAAEYKQNIDGDERNNSENIKKANM